MVIIIMMTRDNNWRNIYNDKGVNYDDNNKLMEKFNYCVIIILVT